ncbi:MAG: lipoyl(octanoyl) transferase LipB [Candidatus Dasytiphilus stammeri]
MPYNNKFIIRHLGLQPWSKVSHAMHQFTQQRHVITIDELWLVEHFPVFTQGTRRDPKHLINTGEIPVLQSDRGGKVTYHGPGQLIMYMMIDLKRRQISVRRLVTAIEQTVIDTLKFFNIEAHVYSNAPGVYINDKKICSLGLRIHHGYSMHGLALNVAMDLSPFERINPCGYANLKMTQLSIFKPEITILQVQPVLIEYFLRNFSSDFKSNEINK